MDGSVLSTPALGRVVALVSAPAEHKQSAQTGGRDETGKHIRLKIWRLVRGLRVQVPPSAP